MWYVYQRNLKTGKEEFVIAFDYDWEAARHIFNCYFGDKETRQLGEYYYFMKKH
jgi:hypothetical protein